MHRSSRLRLASAAIGLILVAGSVAAPVLAGDTRQVSIGSSADGDLPSIAVSVGESITFPLTVANSGKQTLNNVVMTVGRDANVDDETVGPEVPTQPVGLPDGVTISATGCTAAGGVLTCPIGSLRSRPVAFSVTIASTSAAAQVVPLKAVVTVAEIGNDQGANTDTFAAEGQLTLLAADCNAITAQRTGNESTVVSTCGVTASGAGGVSASIKLPAGRTYVSLSDNNPCTGCYGAEVIANIDGDTPNDVVVWIIQIDVTGLGNINLQKLVAVHTNDAGTDTTSIPLTRKNACKSAGSTDCGAATLLTVSGRTILQVTIQTPGNGKTRIF